jgi:hypothetical protein
MAGTVKVSTKAFMKIAASHDQYVRAETGRRLNEKGFIRSFEIGDQVKVRVPPTYEQMLARTLRDHRKDMDNCVPHGRHDHATDA